MSVSFFMFLIFWTPYPGRSIPVFEDLMAYASTGGAIAQFVVYGSMLAIGGLVVKHFQLMWWNWRQYSMAKADGRIDKMLGTNAHTQLLAIPLATAMSVNALFIAGALYVPGLWDVVEYLLPLALMAFLIIGVWALKLYFGFVAEVFHKKAFDKELNNSLAQMLPAFAFGMIAVGYAVMCRMNYFRDLLAPQTNPVNQSPVAFALVCPGVALTVMGQFFINKALVTSGLLVKFGVVYFGLTAIVVTVQLATLWLMFSLIRRQLSGPVQAAPSAQAKAA